MENVHYKRILLSFIAAVVIYLLPLGLMDTPHTMLFVTVFIAMLWITEAAPLYATAIFAAFLMVILSSLKPADVFGQYFDPVIVLLLGGFVIAIAMNKYGFDKFLAYRILSKAGTSPDMVVLALMGTSTFISMWISNSATAAIVMPIALVVLARNKVKRGMSNFGKACVLGVGYGATIGGIGTIIGSTPNVIAAKFLHDSGVQFGFYDWFCRGFPFMLVLMFLGWLILITLFKPEKKKVLPFKHTESMTNDQKKVGAIFVLTVLLWITEPIHGVNSGVVALVPIILFYFTGLLNTDDFMKIDWPTLILLGGSLALGFGIHAAGLDTYLASALSGASGIQNVLMLFLLIGMFGAVITLVISNTTAAAVYLPIVIALASGFGASVTNTVIVAAIGVSLDFIFPFGTPPTAIAYGTKYVNTKDIAKVGIIIAVVGVLLLAFMAMLW
jgi:sodium-dependent dicarboxylate transporter 2/3/5